MLIYNLPMIIEKGGQKSNTLGYKKKKKNQINKTPKTAVNVFVYT
jgi:hypothetical protein